MKWLIPKRRDEPLPRNSSSGRDSVASGNFNGPLPENDGNICVADGYEADDDIRHGRIKQFSDKDELIRSLKEKW